MTRLPATPTVTTTLQEPRLVLRVGVAGAIHLAGGQRARLREKLAELFGALAAQLEALAPPAGPPPVLRLVSGLADGADQAAFEALLSLGPPAAGAQRELVGVLPCDVASFRDHSAVHERAAFADLLGRCTCVIELDGICPPAPDPKRPDGGDRLAITRRNRAFRVQAAVLLRQCDLLVAVADPDAAGAAGGTRETMARAVALGIPVLFLSAVEGSGAPALIERPAELEQLGQATDEQWREALRRAVARLVADPRARGSAGSRLLDEFFTGTPPRTALRSRLWRWFEHRFASPSPRPSPAPGDAERLPDAFRAYHARADAWSSAYTGFYRGAFLLNYGLAVVAVALAVATLVSLVVLARRGVADGSELPWLFALTAVELAVLLAIVINTHQGNRQRWNGKAIDYRYLAERLRPLGYLSRLGDLRVAPPRVARYASTAIPQSVVDWLLRGIVCAAPPDIGWTPAEASSAVTPRIVRVDADRVLEEIRNDWLPAQIAYHRATSVRQRAMHDWIEAWVWRFNLGVIIVVALDAALLLVRLAGARGGWVEAAHAWSPGLVFLAAVLPAAVASLNGIRFQSECLRLAERSALLAGILDGHREECGRLAVAIAASRATGADPGAWTLEALDLAESCAQAAVDDVAEWSVLYAKELLEA